MRASSNTNHTDVFVAMDNDKNVDGTVLNRGDPSILDGHVQASEETVMSSNDSRDIEFNEFIALTEKDRERKGKYMFQYVRLRNIADTKTILDGRSEEKWTLEEKEKEMILSITKGRESLTLQEPELILSITGGCESFTMSQKIMDSFKSKLSELSLHNTDILIISAGTNSGTSKAVGKAVRDYRLLRQGEIDEKDKKQQVSAIGIVTLDKNVDIREQCNGLKPDAKENKIAKTVKAYLDPYHTHFLFLPEMSKEKEIAFRAKFADKLSQSWDKVKQDGKVDRIPHVLMVFEGGQIAFKMVLESLEHNTPVIVFENSGGMADILAYACKNFRDENDSSGYKQAEQDLKEIIKLYLPKESEGVLKMVKKCMEKQKRDLIICFNSNEILSDLDDAILKAISLGNTSSPSPQNDGDIISEKEYEDDLSTSYTDSPALALAGLSGNSIQDSGGDGVQINERMTLDMKQKFLTLAMKWDRFESVPKTVFSGLSEMMESKDKDHKKEQKNLLRESILLDRARFLHLFLASVDTETTLRNETFLKNVFLKDTNEDEYERWRGTWKTVIDRLEKELKLEFAVPSYLKYLRSKDEAKKDVESNKDVEVESNKDVDYNTLFVLCLLLGKQKMAMLFWEEGRSGIPGLVVAYGLLKRMAGRPETDAEEQKLLASYAENFNSIALDVLKLCDDKNEKKTEALLKYKRDEWGEKSCIDIAYETNNKHFLDSDACQNLFLNRWRGKISNNAPRSLLLLGMLFPPFLFALQYKKKKTEAFLNEEQNDRDIHWPKKIYYFYRSPWIVAAYNMVSYIVFLTLYSFMLLTHVKPELSVIDVVLMFWVFSLFTEELRQCFAVEDGTLDVRFSKYITNDFNKLDIVTILLYSVGMVLRFIPGEWYLSAGRIFLGVAFLLFCMRILHIFTVNKQLGPWLIMIRKMTVKLLYFFLILMVFVVSYAIAAHAIAFPNTDISVSVVYDVLRTGYWNIYGELFLEEIEVMEPKCSYNESVYDNDHDITRCPTQIGRYIVPILRAVYVLFSNILLLNLLISVFCNTIEEVQNKASMHWSFERYKIIREYRKRPLLPAPFILLSHMYLVCKWIICPDAFKKDSKVHDQNEIKKNIEINKNLRRWEGAIVANYLQGKTKNKKSNQQTSFERDTELETMKQEMKAYQRTIQEIHKEVTIKLDNVLAALGKTTGSQNKAFT